MMTKRKPVSPGEMLEEEFMKPLGLTQTELARTMGVERRLVNELCNGRRAITADTALRLSRYFGTTPQFWMNLQANYELELAADAWGAEIAVRIRPHHAA